MANEQSILFSPEISERDLDREVDQVNDQLAGVGEDVPVSFDPDEMDIGDGLAPAGGGAGGGVDGLTRYETASLGLMERTLNWQRESAVEDAERNEILAEHGTELQSIRERLGALGDIPEGDGGLELPGAGPGVGGMGQGAAGGALASRLPQSVAGVTAAAAMPVALAGGVGLGMLSAMQSSSARLQTSTSLIGQAWNNVWRPLGDQLDQLFIRDLATDLVDDTRALGDAIREGSFLKGAFAIGELFAEGATGRLVNLLVPPGVGSRVLGQINRSISDAGWTALRKAVIAKWPGWPDILPSWPGWPSIDTDWPGWPDIKVDWPGWPNVKSEWANIGWPEIGTPTWPDSSDILDEFPELSVSGLRDAILGDGDSNGTGGGGGGDGGLWDFEIPFLQSGGRVQRTGAAVVHRNEIVADEDRLVSELASAVSQSTGGRTRRASVDTREMEQKLDELNRNVRRLAESLSTEGIGREEIAYLSADGKRQDISDSNPRV